ncbi:hypothetical protein [Schaalia suimastitidis]|uniref:hypothetical protein n=1 Tax=Schaalia suimastitidis TaxID=121163 RepID=UPI00040E9C9D|nr:hypothetical protein [Schaalia suimastitidis]
MSTESAYHALLRWYPRQWRQEHGDALLTLMLDEAQARGQVRPDSQLRYLVMAHGLAERMSAKTLVFLLAVTCVLSVAYEWIYTRGILVETGIQLPLHFAWANCIHPMLLLVVLACLAYRRGVGEPGRLLAALILAAIAHLLHVGARITWSYLGPGSPYGGGANADMTYRLLAYLAVIIVLAAVSIVLWPHIVRLPFPLAVRVIITGIVAAACAALVAFAQDIPNPLMLDVIVLVGVVMEIYRTRNAAPYQNVQLQTDDPSVTGGATYTKYRAATEVQAAIDSRARAYGQLRHIGADTAGGPAAAHHRVTIVLAVLTLIPCLVALALALLRGFAGENLTPLYWDHITLIVDTIAQVSGFALVIAWARYLAPQSALRLNIWGPAALAMVAMGLQLFLVHGHSIARPIMSAAAEGIFTTALVLSLCALVWFGVSRPTVPVVPRLILVTLGAFVWPAYFYFLSFSWYLHTGPVLAALLLWKCRKYVTARSRKRKVGRH